MKPSEDVTSIIVRQPTRLILHKRSKLRYQHGDHTGDMGLNLTIRYALRYCRKLTFNNDDTACATITGVN
ncbi:hypothetical protein R6Q59_017709 [Mikania micrantha]